METIANPRQAQDSEIETVIERGRMTLAVMHAISETFVWDVCSPEQFALKLDQIVLGPENLNGQRFTRASEEDQAEKQWKQLVEALHRATVTALTVARVAWEGDAERIGIVAGLSASGQTPAEIMDEAEELEAAWAESDPAWVAVDRVTLPQLSAAIVEARTVRRTWRAARARRRRADAKLALAVEEVDRLAKRWYKVVTALFEPGTPEGEQVRHGIPTTYVPRYAEAAKRRRKEKRAAELAAKAQGGGEAGGAGAAGAGGT